MSEVTVARFGPDHVGAFEALHGTAGRCFCVAWWVETWEGWGQRTAEENRARRTGLIDAGTFDGYLAFADENAIGWCQALPRDRLLKVRRQFDLAADDATWAIGCFFIHPDRRRRGVARRLLGAVLDDLPDRGAKRVEAYPKRIPNADAGELWNGPETLFRAHGFVTLKDDPVRPVLGRDLG